MKKFLSVMLVVLLCFGVCACNNTSQIEGASQGEADPIQERKNMLDEAFIKCCDADINFATLTSDCSALTIDTNPDDNEYYSRYEDEATAAIVATNSFLNLPASVTEKMSSTRALDGMQSQNCGDFTVSWTYHPDNGLRVIYEVNFS